MHITYCKIYLVHVLIYTLKEILFLCEIGTTSNQPKRRVRDITYNIYYITSYQRLQYKNKYIFYLIEISASDFRLVLHEYSMEGNVPL